MRAGWLLALGSLGLSLASVASAQAQTCKFLTSKDVIKPQVPEEMCDPGPVVSAIAHYSWHLFIALNWPAEGGTRGQPDGENPDKIIDRTAPRVWETWKSVQETFIPGGEKPAEWDAPETHALCQNSSGLAPLPTKVLADVNQSGFKGRAKGPLVAQNRTYVRYEVRMNRVGFDAIRTQELYLRKKLLPPDSVALPDGAINVKAAWREVRPGENTDRYYRTDALVFDPSNRRCDKRSFVLIGLHIVHKTPQRPQWVWSTFEHVDNYEVGPDAPSGTAPSLSDLKVKEPGKTPTPVDAANPPLPNPEPVQVIVPRIFQPRDVERKVNAEWQRSPQLEKTVWRFYQLIRTQWPAAPLGTDPFGKPEPSEYVANSAIETYFITVDNKHRESTCIGCHFGSRADFTWLINLRAHPLPDALHSNARIFSDTVIKFGGTRVEPRGDQ